jgi:hypothetical protein
MEPGTGRAASSHSVIAHKSRGGFGLKFRMMMARRSD